MNDAGSSNYVCSIISNESKFFNWSIYALANSPGSQKLQNSQIMYTKFFLLDEISDIIKKQKPDIVFYGTGRFNSNAFPDAILVMDDIAYKKANKIFNSKSAIFKIKNYYLDEIKSDYAFREKKKII